MSRRNTKSHVAVEQHLEERRQYEEWLAKLESGASQVPASVIDRVRADYRARLDKVTRELARYEKDLDTSLAEAEVRRDELLAQRSARAEALAETELRHHVGEFDDARFHEQSAELQAGLAKLAEEIGVTERDIARFEEILGLIAGALPEAPLPSSPPPAAVVPAPVPAARAVEPEFIPAPAASSLPQAPPPPPREEPAPAEATIPPKAARQAATTPAEPAATTPAEPAATPAPPPSPALDELAFLRSVGPAAEPGEDATTVPPMPVPPKPIPAGEPPAPAAKKAAPEQPPRPKAEGPKRPSPRDDRAPRPSNAADETAKSLRCTECGTFNLPTEWYCEKCGAELSAF